MFRINDWNENEKFSQRKIAQDVISTSCCIDTTDLEKIYTSCSSNVKTSCCIDTTRFTSLPCGSDIQTSCCIDTTKWVRLLINLTL